MNRFIDHLVVGLILCVFVSMALGTISSCIKTTLAQEVKHEKTNKL